MNNHYLFYSFQWFFPQFITIDGKGENGEVGAAPIISLCYHLPWWSMHIVVIVNIAIVCFQLVCIADMHSSRFFFLFVSYRCNPRAAQQVLVVAIVCYRGFIDYFQPIFVRSCSVCMYMCAVAGWWLRLLFEEPICLPPVQAANEREREGTPFILMPSGCLLRWKVEGLKLQLTNRQRKLGTGMGWEAELGAGRIQRMHAVRVLSHWGTPFKVDHETRTITNLSPPPPHSGRLCSPEGVLVGGRSKLRHTNRSRCIKINKLEQTASTGAVRWWWSFHLNEGYKTCAWLVIQELGNDQWYHLTQLQIFSTWNPGSGFWTLRAWKVFI